MGGGSVVLCLLELRMVGKSYWIYDYIRFLHFDPPEIEENLPRQQI